MGKTAVGQHTKTLRRDRLKSSANPCVFDDLALGVNDRRLPIQTDKEETLRTVRK